MCGGGARVLSIVLDDLMIVPPLFSVCLSPSLFLLSLSLVCLSPIIKITIIKIIQSDMLHI